ncbi:MAG: site-specific integrase [Actinomycetota bacterium]|nr:site-specific integrase [Actinomycetota bacterium]
MSVERVVRSNGEVVWRVRWREGARNRSRVLGRKRDADAFDAEVRRRRRTGELAALDAGRETLAHFAETWWQLYALPNLAPRTRASYAHIWDRHVLPRLGALPLREINTLVVGRLAADLEQAGIGPAARRKALAVLSGVLQRAVEWGRLPANPARAVRSPSAPRARAVRPLPPAEVEAIREQLIAAGRLRDATLVSVLAYVGPAPPKPSVCGRTLASGR